MTVRAVIFTAPSDTETPSARLRFAGKETAEVRRIVPLETESESGVSAPNARVPVPVFFSDVPLPKVIAERSNVLPDETDTVAVASLR